MCTCVGVGGGGGGGGGEGEREGGREFSTANKFQNKGKSVPAFTCLLCLCACCRFQTTSVIFV